MPTTVWLVPNRLVVLTELIVHCPHNEASVFSMIMSRASDGDAGTVSLGKVKVAALVVMEQTLILNTAVLEEAEIPWVKETVPPESVPAVELVDTEDPPTAPHIIAKVRP